jgi:hypothetical protein
MFLAQNKTDIAQAQAFLTQHMQAQPDLYWVALVDSAFDHDIDGTDPCYRQGMNCYEGYPLDDLASIAPWLVPLSADEEGFVFLAKLLAHCSGRPMLSVMASRIQARELLKRWLPLHRVRTADEQRMLLRFADTRILPMLPSMLKPDQWAAFAGPFEHWFYVDRTGIATACTLPPPGLQPIAPPLRFTQDQIDVATDAAEADTMLDFMADYQPDVFPWNEEPATVYQHAAELAALARKCRVEEWDDKLALITASFLRRGEIRGNPQLEVLLRSKDWTPRHLRQELIKRGVV